MKTKFEIRKRGAGCTVRLRSPDGLHVSVYVPKGASQDLLKKQAIVTAMAIYAMLPNWKDRDQLRGEFDAAVKRFWKRERS